MKLCLALHRTTTSSMTPRSPLQGTFSETKDPTKERLASHGTRISSKVGPQTRKFGTELTHTRRLGIEHRCSDGNSVQLPNSRWVHFIWSSGRRIPGCNAGSGDAPLRDASAGVPVKLSAAGG